MEDQTMSLYRILKGMFSPAWSPGHTCWWCILDEILTVYSNIGLKEISDVVHILRVVDTLLGPRRTGMYPTSRGSVLP